jgi:hypothetical protein
VLDEFRDDPEQMHRYAQTVRQAAERDELGNVSQLVGDEYERPGRPLPAPLAQSKRA